RSLEFCFNLSCFCLTQFIFFDGGQPLLLSFGSLAFYFSIGCRLCLALLLFFESLLLSFCSLAFCFSVGGRLRLTLFHFLEPLLLSFHGLGLRFGVGNRLGPVGARRIRCPRHPHRYTHLIESDPAYQQQRRCTSR